MTAKIKICWRGVLDDALETTWGGNPVRTWESNVPQEVLMKEDSHKLRKDGWTIEESEPEIAPDGRRLLVTKSRWISMHEAASAHPCFDVEGEQPKKMKKPARPTHYPNAAREDPDHPWIGANG